MNLKFKKTRAVVKHVRDHRVAYAVIGTASVCLYMNRQALKEHDEFLKAKGLYNEFYLPEA